MYEVLKNLASRPERHFQKTASDNPTNPTQNWK
jgi:hypothetical protein